MGAIRAELDKKEGELSRAIAQMRDRKLAAIESEARWATDKLERVTKGTELAGRVVFSNTKLMSFFQELMKNEDEFLEIVGIPVKEIQPNTARLPQLPTRGLSNALQQLRYVENRGSVYDASPNTGNWDLYYDESSSEDE
jgi:hypothetical protein